MVPWGQWPTAQPGPRTDRQDTDEGEGEGEDEGEDEDEDEEAEDEGEDEDGDEDEDEDKDEDKQTERRTDIETDRWHTIFLASFLLKLYHVKRLRMIIIYTKVIITIPW